MLVWFRAVTLEELRTFDTLVMLVPLAETIAVRFAIFVTLVELDMFNDPFTAPTDDTFDTFDMFDDTFATPAATTDAFDTFDIFDPFAGGTAALAFAETLAEALAGAGGGATTGKM